MSCIVTCASAQRICSDLSSVSKIEAWGSRCYSCAPIHDSYIPAWRLASAVTSRRQTVMIVRLGDNASDKIYDKNDQVDDFVILRITPEQDRVHSPTISPVGKDRCRKHTCEKTWLASMHCRGGKEAPLLSLLKDILNQSGVAKSRDSNLCRWACDSVFRMQKTNVIFIQIDNENTACNCNCISHTVSIIIFEWLNGIIFAAISLWKSFSFPLVF